MIIIIFFENMVFYAFLACLFNVHYLIFCLWSWICIFYYEYIWKRSIDPLQRHTSLDCITQLSALAAHSLQCWGQLSLLSSMGRTFHESAYSILPLDSRLKPAYMHASSVFFTGNHCDTQLWAQCSAEVNSAFHFLWDVRNTSINACRLL